MSYSGMHDDWSRDWRGYSSRAERDADLEEAMCLAEAERGARWYFDRATVGEKAEFDLTVATAVRLHGHGSMAHEATINLARAQFEHDTREARALYHRTVECLLADGEVSDALDYEWTRLTDPAKAAEMWPERNPLLEVAKDALRVLTAHNLGDEIDLGYIEGVIAKAEADSRNPSKREAA